VGDGNLTRQHCKEGVKPRAAATSTMPNLRMIILQSWPVEEYFCKLINRPSTKSVGLFIQDLKNDFI